VQADLIDHGLTVLVPAKGLERGADGYCECSEIEEKMNQRPSIVVIDDDPVIGQFLSHVGAGLDVNCVVTTSGERFLELLRPDTSLIFLDLLMPDLDGIELLRRLSERRCKTPIILMSGTDRRVLDTAERLAKALDLQVAGRLRKPFHLAQVETILQEFHRPDMRVTCDHAASVSISDADLIKAVEEDEFVVHYQPQIDLCTDKVVGVEALIRWRRSGGTLIFPDFFIPRIEALGLIDRLGLLAQRRSLSELEQFVQPGKNHLTLSVNVSASSLLDLSLPDTLLSLANEHGIDPERIIVEVTESGFFTDLSKILDVLARLRLKGFQLSIDDFGTGYAMMQQLRYIPATEIKIDRSFVRNMQMSHSDRVVVEKTVEIGHELGMRVVAEGVETIDQLRFLRSIGCDVVQGFYFSKALESATLQGWLSKYRGAPDMDAELGASVDERPWALRHAEL
jgi:EAL domain-containing protein (putative c-di-GMP-specific phosphodiesterase class I)/ActR/RegA family two-component response regulator